MTIIHYDDINDEMFDPLTVCMKDKTFVSSLAVLSNLQLSLEIFRECSEMCCLPTTFGESLKMFRKWLEIFGKLTETSYLVCL